MSFKWWLLVAAGLFAFGLMTGLLVPVGNAGLLEDEASALSELADLISPLPQASLFVFIFLKNLSVIVISLALSPLFCLFPAIALVVNGGVIGLVSSLVIKETSLSFLLAGLLPHGILELPALLIGEAATLSFGMSVIIGVFSRKRRGDILPNLKQNLKYLGLSAGLFLAAALIETWLTPQLMNIVR